MHCDFDVFIGVVHVKMAKRYKYAVTLLAFNVSDMTSRHHSDVLHNGDLCGFNIMK